MQVPDYTFRPLTGNEQVRDDEVEVTAAQKVRIERLLDEDRAARAAMLARRPGNTKSAKRRKG